MKKLELADIHEKLGAKMVDFAGYYMPIQYSSVIEEHNAVRNQVGIFDVSHMGEIFISGEEAILLLQYITSNDVSLLYPGKAQYTYLPNKNGGIIDDCLLYMISEAQYMLVVNASNINKVKKWIHEHNTFNCKIEDKSEDYCLLAIQGPKSLKLLQKITDHKLNNIKYYHFIIGKISTINNVIISRTGYTGEIGFELYVKRKDVKKLWNLILMSPISIKPIGLAARNTLRIEKGYCLYGNEINNDSCPIEAGLEWISKFNTKFINYKSLQKKITNKVLIGLELVEKGIARKDHIVLSNKKEKIGIVTSGTHSPTLGKAIALAYISKEFTKEDIIFIQIRKKIIKAKIVSLPFI